MTWACGAVEHGTEFINDFEDVCDAIAEEVPEGAAYADVIDFLTEELGDDAPTEEEWNAINWACDAAAEYGEDEDDSTPVPTTEAQIKDDTVSGEEHHDHDHSGEEHHHCEDLAHLADIGILDKTWDEIFAHIVDAHGAEGAPTEAEFDAEVAYCASQPAPQGPAQPHGDGAAQIKDDSEGPTEEEIADLFEACAVLELIPEGAHWTEVEAILVEEFAADDGPTKKEWKEFQDFCAGAADF